jgi:hypothetical protein
VTGQPLRPIDPDDAYVQALAYIDLARTRGVPWDALAAQLGVPGKAAAKKLRAEYARQVLLLQAGLRERKPVEVKAPDWFDSAAAALVAGSLVTVNGSNFRSEGTDGLPGAGPHGSP